MKSNIAIKSAKYVNGYKIEITFNDERSNICDFGEFLKNSSHPEVQKYLEPKLFKKFKVEHGDLMWGNFDLIFPIQDLYENVISKKNLNKEGAA